MTDHSRQTIKREIRDSYYTINLYAIFSENGKITILSSIFNHITTQLDIFPLSFVQFITSNRDKNLKDMHGCILTRRS